MRSRPLASHTGASSACASSSRHSEGQISTERPARRLSTIDRAGNASRAGPPAERNQRARCPAPFEFHPHLVADELASAATQTRRMRTRGEPARRRRAHLTRARATCRTRSAAPSAREMHPGRRRLALAQRMRRASCARRRPAIRAPLLEPLSMVAHGPVPGAATGDDGGFRRVRASAGAPHMHPTAALIGAFAALGRLQNQLLCRASLLVPPAGLEPAISCVKGRRPNR